MDLRLTKDGLKSDAEARLSPKDLIVDFEMKLRDPAFMKWYVDACRRLDKASAVAFKDRRAAATRDGILFRILQATGFNLAPFLPYYFPKYPQSDPLTLKDYPTNYMLYGMPVGSSIVVRGARQLGKSVSLSTRQIMTTWAIPHYRSLYIAPHPQQLNTYRDTMAEMMRSFRFKIPGNLKQNLQYREMPQGGVIKLVNVLTSAHPVRGNHFDEVLYDEYQNMDINLEGQIDEVTSASRYKLKVYAGTSLTTDTALEYRYKQSTQSVWLIKCPACNFDNWADADCTHGDKGVLDMVQKNGPCCIKCGKILNVRRGFWAHRNSEGVDAGFFGMHLPQIIVPAKTEDPFNWADIYKKKLEITKVADFYKEKLGIPLESGEREITLAHLRQMCTDYQQQHYLDQVKGGRIYKYIVSGVDWGGSDYDPAKKTKTSYTLHLMLGIRFDGHMEILRMDQHAGADFRSIAARIIDTHIKYKGQAISSDAGGGAAYNILLRDRINPTQHLILKYTAPNAKIMEPIKGSSLTNYYGLNRTESITEVYNMIKYGRISCYRFDEAQPMLEQILALFRAPFENEKTGERGFTYVRDPAKPDDVLHALNFAVVTAKCLLGEPMFKDRAMQEHIMMQLRAGGVEPPKGIANMHTGTVTPFQFGGVISG